MTNEKRDAGEWLQEEVIGTPAAALALRNRTMLDEGTRFPGDRDPLLYDKNLEGVPFVFASMPVSKTVNGKFGERDVVFILVRFYDPTTEELSDATRVMLSGAYIINQIRRMTRGELIGSNIFTLARNENMPRTRQGAYPLMLAVWDESLDSAASAAPLEGHDNDGSWTFDSAPTARSPRPGRPRTK